MLRNGWGGYLVALAGAAMLAGCADGLGGSSIRKTETLPPVDRAGASAASLSRQLVVLQRLIQGAPAEQAEILAAAKHAYDTAPIPSNELAYALVLATPGHPGFDAARAEKLLRDALATPETLLPSERAIAVVTMRTTERQLALTAENQRLQAQAERSAGDDGERTAALDHKLQGEQEENAKLRKELEEARSKLDAIANIERSLNARKNRTEGSTQ
ncbi:MAG TPA: hypothetical protein VGI35_06910 [Steroidobacteraceae bacterium]